MRHLLAVLLLLTGLQAATTPRPDFGLIFNDDADLAFVDPDRSTAEALLRANVAAWGGSGIRTFVFCVGMGGDVLYYPTITFEEQKVAKAFATSLGLRIQYPLPPHRGQRSS